ncbi:MAG: hypothetical protein ACHQ51_01985 [Elusimicrobiota bacterium]
MVGPLLAALLACTAYAESPRMEMVGVKIFLTSSTVVGYVVRDPKEPTLSLRKGAAYLESLKKQSQIRIWPHVAIVKLFGHEFYGYPKGEIEPLRVKQADIKRVELQPSMPLYGRQDALGAIEIDAALTGKLNTPPFFHCTVPLYDSEDVYWISYNQNVGKKELDQVCALKVPNPEIEDAMEKTPNVWRIVAAFPD